jgi:hypothetical protein
MNSRRVEEDFPVPSGTVTQCSILIVVMVRVE